MAEITNELMHELLKHIGQREHSAALNAIRFHMDGMQQDIQNLYAAFTRDETQLDRIERRLEITEVSG
jgi:hypothetical protein